MTSQQKKFVGIPVNERSADTGEFASHVERFFTNVFAPNILSKRGRIIILIAYVIWSAVEIYGVVNMKTDFSVEYFLPEGCITDDYFQMDLKYF